MTKVTFETPVPPPPSTSKLTTVFKNVQNKVLRRETPSKDPGDVDKPIETIHPNNLPQATKEGMAKCLSLIVEHSSKYGEVSESIHARMFGLGDLKWIHKLVPGIEKLSAKYHIGNFVVVRGTGERVFESMPLYARIGMHLLFYGKEQVKLVESKTVENLLRDESIKQGKIYDDPKSVASIPSFIKTYSIKTDELLDPDLSSYKSFNEFFYRKLKPDERPVQNIDDPAGFCSAADCRLTVYETVDLAKKFWVKGDQFTIPNLLGITPGEAKPFQDASLAIFRLAPCDYHRFHSPLDGFVGDMTHIPGQYYTVNPQAVNEEALDVFTANTRSVLYLSHAQTRRQVAFVAVGALLVGSIKWTKEKGEMVKRGEELGYFAYGGSTIILMFPKGTIKFDEDLITNSEEPVETLMKVGYSIGRIPGK